VVSIRSAAKPAAGPSARCWPFDLRPNRQVCAPVRLMPPPIRGRTLAESGAQPAPNLLLRPPSPKHQRQDPWVDGFSSM